jgi:hypothetical protein
MTAAAAVALRAARVRRADGRVCACALTDKMSSMTTINLSLIEQPPKIVCAKFADRYREERRRVRSLAFRDSLHARKVRRNDERGTMNDE